jgi:hypothetical protein
VSLRLQNQPAVSPMRISRILNHCSGFERLQQSGR